MYRYQPRKWTLRWISSTIACATLLMTELNSDVSAVERTYTADGDVKVIRLPAQASARGWIGRRLHRKSSRRTTNTYPPAGPKFIKSQPLISPPPAPPREPLSTAKPNAGQPGNTLRDTKPKRAAPVKESVKKSPSVPRTLKLISHSVSTRDKSPGTAPDGDDDDGSASDTDEKAVPPQELEIFRPLTDVSLATAIQSTDLDDEELRQPENQARAMYSELGVFVDLPVSHTPADGQGWSCNYRIFYQPLYFEDPNMERCGQGPGCFTEVASVVRFFGRIPITPYLIGSNPPCTCVESLGYCPSCHRYGFHAYVPPLNVPGVAAQAAAVVGLVFLIP